MCIKCKIAGYSGDGVTCRFVGVCNQNNGGCTPIATCEEAPSQY